MKKRTFLRALLATGSAVLVTDRYSPGRNANVPPVVLAPPPAEAPPSPPPLLVDTTPEEEIDLMLLQESELRAGYQHGERVQNSDRGTVVQNPVDVVERLPDDTLDSYLQKVRNFDADFTSDVHLGDNNGRLLLPTLARLERVQNFVGHAHFNLIGFEEMLYFARNYPDIGAFEKAEVDFMDEIFNTDARAYGFFGEKVSPHLNHRIAQRDVEKIAGSGHYLLKGESLNHYLRIRKDVGEQLLLTSGVRNNVKQLHLFLAKTLQSDGNLSRASRSLAPPGYSFHNAGDFDVGKIGLGESNFTADFSHTDEFRRLINLGYVDIRYTDSNELGVRYEPWHIKLACDHHDHTCA
ncbi:MAG TPA: M15 family metallopeptidase [Pseudomonadales bacterium]